jgi:hypothetical protein
VFDNARVRLWSLHPRLLDAKGLVALWREALLAHAVLKGNTRGYRHHPQLERFQETDKPVASICAYLHEVRAEALRRGYAFDRARYGRVCEVAPIPVTDRQIAYEWMHLKRKLRERAPDLYRSCRSLEPEAHPLFAPVAGAIAPWEKR